MLKKILKINNFGSFKNFNADENLAEFKKYNLIWGLNGTGKTTLSNLFVCLNNGNIDEKFFDKESFKEDFDILLDNNQHIKTFKDNVYCNKIKVFNRDFVYNNLTLDNNNAQTNALTYTIGETAKDIKNKISEAKKKLESYYTEIHGKNILIVQNEYDKLYEELEKIHRNAAELIRLDLNIKNAPEYNIKQFKQDYDRYCDNNTTITEDEKNEYAKTYIQPIKSQISPINCDIISDSTIILFENILGKEYKRADIKEELVQWLEKGLNLKNENICPFCNQTISNWEHRYDEIQNIVKKDDTFLEFEKNLQDLQLIFNATFNNLKNIVFSLRPEDFCNKVSQEILNKYYIAFDNYKNFIDIAIKMLNQKKNTPDKTFLLENKEVIQNYIDVKNSLNELITEHNTNTANIRSIKENAKNIVIGYYVQQCKDNVFDIMQKLNDLDKSIKETKIKIEIIKQEINNLNAELTNQKAPMSEIEKYIYIVFGCKKFTLNYDEEAQSYSIYRENGEIAKNLSEGEKTVIAFAYFLATLKTHNFDMKNAIIVIDDPVSSLDQQYLYNLINLIGMKFNKPTTFDQLFILTHNFYFYKKIRAILRYKGKDMHELFQVVKNETSSIKNVDKYLREYTSEYTHTIKYLKEVLEMDDDKIKEIPLGNSIRKILEIFLAFRSPRKNSIAQRFDVVTSHLEFEEKGRFQYLQDIANASSHTEECEDLEALEEFKLFITKNEIKQLFDFIKAIDEKHYNEIMQL